jgi:hypothetical protein
MDDAPRDTPVELPADYRAFRRAYRWPLLYGPWALGLVGLGMVGIGLFGDRPGEVALATIGFGAAMVIASVLLPRMQGQLELGPSGVKGAVHGLPAPFMVAAATAREVAEATIPADEPDRDRKVDEAVGRAASYWVLPAQRHTDLGPVTGEDVGRWAIEAVDLMLATGQRWTDEDWRRWFQARHREHAERSRRHERRRKPPDDQDRDTPKE